MLIAVRSPATALKRSKGLLQGCRLGAQSLQVIDYGGRQIGEAAILQGQEVTQYRKASDRRPERRGKGAVRTPARLLDCGANGIADRYEVGAIVRRVALINHCLQLSLFW